MIFKAILAKNIKMSIINKNKNMNRFGSEKIPKNLKNEKSS